MAWTFLKPVGGELNLAADQRPLKARGKITTPVPKPWIVWGPAAAWAAVLFFLSSIPDAGLPAVGVNDKVVHFCLYAVFGVALARGWDRAAHPPSHAALLLLGALYGASDEWHQTFVLGRDASLGDWTADLLGVGIGYLLMVRFVVWSAQTRRSEPIG